VRKRTITSIVLGFMILLSVVSYNICFLVLMTFILISLWEFFDMIEKKGVSLFRGFGLFLGGIIPASIFYRFPVTVEIQFIFIIVALFLLFILELTRKKNHQTILSISATVFGVIYISWCLSFIIRIRGIDPQVGNGPWLLAFLIIVTKASDIGAYIIGSKFGRRPLLKRVSPNKSLEGSLGGLLASVICGIILNKFIGFCVWYQAIFISFVLGIIGQLGDLFESLLKRDSGVKDAGTILPGMGGMLDVVDSVIFTAPVFYFYIIAII